MRFGEILARQLQAAGTPDSGAPQSRRDWLLSGAAALTAGLVSQAQAAPPRSSGRWLINRLTFGYTPEEQALMDELGYYGYLEYHLNHTAIDDSVVNAKLQPYYTLNWSPYLLYLEHASVVVNQLIESSIIRAVYSKRQLYERMVEFWSDHFYVSSLKAFNPWLKTYDDRVVARPHALGRFSDMLQASAQSTAMLIYLDNQTSIAGNQNENYARELLELHTLGVDGGYTQQDVVEVARCLTGWGDYQGPTYQNWFTYYFDPAKHDDGQKVVLGQVIPAGGGINDGFMVLDILAQHPSTARYISKKLCQRFYSYDPPQSLINTVAATFTASQGDIKAVLRTLFSNIDPNTAPPKLKRPVHLFASALRAAGATIAGSPTSYGSDLRNQYAAAGHEPFSWGTPDGWPDKLESWSGLLLPRWNFGSLLLNGNLNGVSVDVNVMLAGAMTAQQVADRIDRVMFGGAMPSQEKALIRDYLLPDNPEDVRKREAVALAIASPAFQWY